MIFYANCYAQKIIEKSLITDATSFVFEFDIIDQIVIEQSPIFNEVTISAESEESNTPNFSMQEKNGNIFIKSNEVKFDTDDKELSKICKVQPIYTSFKIMIPKGKNVFVSYVDGNFYLNNFDGNLKLTLNDGIVNLNHFMGTVDVKLNGGNVYCTELQDTEIDIISNMGMVTSSVIIDNALKTNNQLKGVYGQQVNKLDVNAISANIYLE